jgi:flagellin
MSKINTNMASVTTLYHLNSKEGDMNKSLERISSGLRLNHAVDDAAGASIVNRMTSQIKGIEAAIRNAADAISLTQTAEGSLEEVSQILHRMRELSVQAANGVYTGQDRQALNNEIVAMQNELARIAESSTFNSVKMLNGDFQDTTFQIGFQANDTAYLSIEDVRPQGLGEYVLSTSNQNVADVVIGAAASTRTASTASGVTAVAEIATIQITNKGTPAANDVYTITDGTNSITVTDAGPAANIEAIVNLIVALDTTALGVNLTKSGTDTVVFTQKVGGDFTGGYSISKTTGSNPPTFGAAATGTNGVKATSSSAISSPEGDVSIALTKMSGDATTANSINKIAATTTGGTFTLSGTDAARFAISAVTGAVTARLDFDNPTDNGTNNVYDFQVNYAKAGVTLVTETVALTITNRIADDNNTQVQAAAQPKLGTTLASVASGIVETENLTIYGNVGTKTVDVNGGSTARDVVSAINSVQGDTGVYAESQTRVNITFPDQSAAVQDTVSFKLYGKNTTPQIISGTVDFGITGGRDADLRALADAVNGASGTTGVTARVSPNGAQLSLVSNEGYDIVIEGYELTANTISANVFPADENLVSLGAASTMTEGAANNNSMRVSGVLKFHSPYVFSIATAATGADGGGLFQETPGAAILSAVSDLNVLTVDQAKKMLTAVDGALVRVDLERSDLGATMSRMEYTIANLSNISLNTKGARSRIQDADIAAETVELNRAQVLSQAAQAMLAQANRTSQSILSLLQG